MTMLLVSHPMRILVTQHSINPIQSLEHDPAGQHHRCLLIRLRILPIGHDTYRKGKQKQTICSSPYLLGLFCSRAPPAFPMGNSPVFNNQQKCHSLVDANYPLFADVCGAVPQARYSLPNAFGHRDRWQITQFLHGMISSSNDATCTRSLKLLMCPLLFPTCPPSQYQASSMLPCQSYCRGE